MGRRRALITLGIGLFYVLMAAPVHPKETKERQAASLPLPTGPGITSGDLLKGAKYVPNEIIVKFRQPMAIRLEGGLKKGISPQGLLLGEPGEIARQYRIREIKSVFKNFKEKKLRFERLVHQDKASLSPLEKLLVRRQKHERPQTPVPDLEGIYQIKLELDEDQTLEEVLQVYRQDPQVEYAELNYMVSINAVPTDSLFSVQWPLHNTGQLYPASGRYNNPPGKIDSDVDAPEAWDLHTGSSEVVIAVVDTGVDYHHRDLAHNIWINPTEQFGAAGYDDDGNGCQDDIYGWDFLNNDNDPLDDNGHGTHCAGVIAAEGNNGLDITGVCWTSRVMGLKFLDRDGFGDTIDAVEAIYYAVNNGANIISNSWGGGPFSETMRRAINYAHSQGVIVVASAGNEDSEDPTYPASYDHVIAVAALDSHDEMAPFTNRGDWVDLAAPGVDILSLRAAGTSMGTVYNNYTTIDSGTSMACPHVSGACGLLLSVNPMLTNDQAGEIITSTGDPTAWGISVSNTRLNLHSALRAAAPAKGSVDLDRDVYSAASVVTILLADGDLAGNVNQAVTLRVSQEDLETVTLTESAGAIGIFQGTISLSDSPGVCQDGVLQAFHGDIITAEYQDPNDGAGKAALAIDTAAIDYKNPVIFNVQVMPFGPEPIINFETDEPARAQVWCGRNCAEPNEIFRIHTTLADSHTFNLKGVLPETEYFFIIEAVDAADNRTRDDNAGGCYVFTANGPGDIYVPDDFATIQEAVTGSWDGGTVWVADGIYTGAGNHDIDFAGRIITVQSENGPAACIIDCQGTAPEPHRGFYFRRQEPAAAVLCGFTITNGYAPDGYGGGIKCIDSSPTIKSCHIVNNEASDYGGGIFCLDSQAQIIDCVITHNTAAIGGGVMGGIITIDRCDISNNQAGAGGGIYLFFGNGIINNSLISKNEAANLGGGVLAHMNSSPVIKGCTISGNRAGGNGGGIHCWVNSSPKISNCIFSANTSAAKGGGIYCTLWSHPFINNCTFYANSSAYGGGVYCRAESYPVIINSIMWADMPTEIFEEDSPPQVIYSDIQGGWSGLGNIDADPLFAAPGYWDNDDTPTDPNDDFWVEGDYHLQSFGWRWDPDFKRWTWDYVTSRGIDGGNPAYVLGDELLTISEDVTNNWGRNLRLNMGAYGGTVEASMAPPGWALLADVNNDGMVNLRDYAHLTCDWLKNIPTQPGNLNRDQIIDILDLALLVADWLKKTPWH